MHHQDFSGDPPGTGSRKSAYQYRRGSSGTSVSSAGGGGGVNTIDDNASQSGSSSPGLHQQQAQSQVAGAQVKKKSGFQITSVTSAQINVSGNNSLADDTESYDDMDESHTEDLSSSDILDVSVSRATDIGVPERSSSDETLNSLHGVDTPGLVSPNEPLLPHSIQGSQKQTSMVNGTAHPHYYPPQQSLPQHQHSNSLGGGEPSFPALPVSPLASSSPAMVSKAGTSQSQRPPAQDKNKQAIGTIQPLAPIVGGTATDAHLQGSVNFSNVSVAAVTHSGLSGFDNTSVSGQVASTGGGTGQSTVAPNTQSQHTQTATGSRFRVVKLDTNSEPFRKGRWTCTEYYEKEIPPAPVSEATKGADSVAESEAGNIGIGPGVPAVPPHTLQPYPLPSQDFTSPQAMQSPPQGPGAYVSPQEIIGTAHIQKPVAPATLPTVTPQVTTQGGVNPTFAIPQQLPFVVDCHQVPAPGGYTASQLSAGVMTQASVLQPDFIQPTAPFQTQVQPPLPHVTASITPGTGVPAQASVNISHQQPHQGQVAPPALSVAAGLPQTVASQSLQQQPPAQPHSTATVTLAPTGGTPYMPLTALQADLRPLLTPGTTLSQVPVGGSSIKTQLEDAQKLLFQHQGLLGLPRLGMGTGPEVTSDASIAVGALTHMGMSAEASAFMAAAAGLRTQHPEGEDDSSSGASVVAIDNKIEQAMDLVKSHLMYAVREEVEVLKEEIKALHERNTRLEQENTLLKTLASPEQMAQFQAQVQTGGSPTTTVQPSVPGSAGSAQVVPSTQNSGTSA